MKTETTVSISSELRVRLTWRAESLTLKMFLEEIDSASPKIVKPWIQKDFTSINARKVDASDTGEMVTDFVRRNNLRGFAGEIQNQIDSLVGKTK